MGKVTIKPSLIRPAWVLYRPEAYPAFLRDRFMWEPKNEPHSPDHPPPGPYPADENALAAAVRKILPSGVADKCQIQVIVQMTGDKQADGESPVSPAEVSAPENVAE